MGCFAEDDLHNAPDGRWGLSFDDGPTAASSSLYTFLESMNQSATHYFIGGNCVNNQECESALLALLERRKPS